MFQVYHEIKPGKNTGLRVPRARISSYLVLARLKNTRQ